MEAPDRRPEAAVLGRILADLGSFAVATSGGVDSMTLAVLAHRTVGRRARVVHATSAAVPRSAGARVRHYAAREGWRLTVLDAGELEDPRYRRNPANRCFFCKTNLYAAMADRVALPLVSGTNQDDLEDYRPGLQAAADHGVRHPFVEAGIDKEGVRALARSLALHDLAELPASPCMSSRVETGIAIEAATLEAIDRAETLVRFELGARTVRCRLRHDAIVVELGARDFERWQQRSNDCLSATLAALFRQAVGIRPVRFAPYRRGSAFLLPVVGQAEP